MEIHFEFNGDYYFFQAVSDIHKLPTPLREVLLVLRGHGINALYDGYYDVKAQFGLVLLDKPITVGFRELEMIGGTKLNPMPDRSVSVFMRELYAHVLYDGPLLEQVNANRDLLLSKV